MGGYQAVESNYDIQYKRRGVEQAVGSGAFAEVRPCTHTSTKELRAVKSIEKTSWYTRGKVMEEISTLNAVSGKHPNIIHFFEYYEEWGVLNLIFEYCPKGTLEQLISGDNAPTSESIVAAFTHQLISALAFLKEVTILHRDVKPANVLLVDEKTLKLADFGVACFCYEPLTCCEGTPAFFSPEMHQLPRGKGYSFPLDMWATGIALYMTLFKGEHPFTDRGVVSKDLVRNGEFQVGWLTSGKVADLLEWLLMPNPEQRISASDALLHPWFLSCGVGKGGFAKKKPPKLVLDSHGNWLKAY